MGGGSDAAEPAMAKTLTPIGGEMHHPADPLFRYATDSGRSSLRLALRAVRGRRFALPDFLCGVIVDTFRACGAAHGFYRVNEDLTIDYESLGRDFDVLYVIDHFGKPAAVDRARVPPGTVILRDGVFLPTPPASADHGDWIWFNSLRKISPLPDGSLVASTIALDAEAIRPGPAPFVAAKRRAKAMKDAWLRAGAGSEDAYLAVFREGEALIDQQAEVFAISPHSLAMLVDFQANLAGEASVRQANYDLLHRRLGAFALDLGPGFKTLFVIAVDDRDALRRFLFDRRIFLPVHWPDTHGLGNRLYDRIISVPVDSRYGEGEMTRVASCILEFAARVRS